MLNPTFATKVGTVLDEVKDVVVSKNARYGNSALEPVRIFSRASTDEQLLVRLDDKLSRIAKGRDDLDDEDVLVDLVGYLVLLLISKRGL